jgi:uncharacterized protein YqeY
MNLEQQISQGIKTAMIQKNASRLRALRGIKSQIDLLNASGKEVTQDMILVTLQKMVKQRKESAEIYKTNKREDLFQAEVEEIAVIEEFLPHQLTKEEIELEVKQIVSNLGATSIKDMGKVMSMASKTLSGRADNKIVSEVVKSVLQ